VIFVGIDPGNMTGLAWWSLGDTAPTAEEIPAAQMGNVLRRRLAMFPVGTPVRITGERYTISSGVLTPQPAALEVMGVVKDMAQLHGVPLHWAQPKDAKRSYPDKILRQLGWYIRTKDGHANDGMRQILVGLVRYDPALYADLLGI